MSLSSSRQNERCVLIDGFHIYHEFIESVALMDDHGYDVDEIIALFAKWKHLSTRRRSDLVADYVDVLFDKGTESGADDWATLVCAMETLYKQIDSVLHQAPIPVIHAAYYVDTECLEIILGNSRDDRDHPRVSSLS